MISILQGNDTANTSNSQTNNSDSQGSVVEAEMHRTPVCIQDIGMD